MAEIDLTPITRLEYDIDAIINDHSVIDPVTRIEQMLSDIKDGTPTAVEPVTRIETFLANISGVDIARPEPVTRIETFLAIIAGGDYEAPEPATRLEGLLAEWVEKGAGFWKTVTGTLIHIIDALASPMQKCEVTFEPIQAGSGDPSPTNVRPITGWTGCEVWNDPKYGGLINWNQIIQNGDFASVTGWEFIGNTHSVSDGVLSITGTEELNVVYKAIQFTANHKYIFKESIKASSAHNYQITLGSSVSLATLEATTVWSDKYVKFTYNATSINLNIYRGTSGNTVQIKNVFLIDLTEMFGAGNEPSTVDEFKALFPKDYYPYNAGTETTVSAVNGDPYQHLSVTFPDSTGTVYGGTVDFVSGVLTVNKKYESLAGRAWSNNNTGANSFEAYTHSISGKKKGVLNIISDAFQTKAFADIADYSVHGFAADGDIAIKVPKIVAANSNELKSFLDSNNFCVCFELATPIEISLTPQEISTLKGENNVWGSGDIELTYKAQSS